MPERSPESLLGSLLQALARSLDVRESFARISEEAQRLVPHDFLWLGKVTDGRVELIALSGELPEGLRKVSIPDSLRTLDDEVIVLNEMKREGDTMRGVLRVGAQGCARDVTFPVQPLFEELVGVIGYRSFMRLSVRLHGGTVGGLVFCSRRSDAFPSADIDPAHLIADCVALAIAHQRLAEEKQRSVEARERAARLELRVQQLTDELEEKGRQRTIGQSKAWKGVLSQAAKVAPTEATVLLTGESGTGKEVVARFIHQASSRTAGPFVALNCAALPETLLESELFGHEKGSFTGALTSRPGMVEQAGGGVLFLDEVGDMSPAVQAKFLRVLQEREFQRLGSTRVLKADVRVLAATNRNLKAAIDNGTFRSDLYYRLAVVEIALPPLRERGEDIELLIDAFLQDIGRSVGRPAAGISEEVRDTLVTYGWPGNVRELRNAIERAVIMCEGGLITSEHLPLGLLSSSPPSDTLRPTRAREKGTLQATERNMIEQALSKSGHNKSKAARLLGLTRAQLRSRIEKYGLSDR